jgi:DNA-binding NarL/FixJ family response regulator
MFDSDIRILMIDKQRLFLEGLTTLFAEEPGLLVVGMAANRAEALAAADMQPDIILLELILGDERGLDFLPDLLQTAKRARVLIVTEALDFELHLRAVLRGAMGVVPKTEPAITLLKAIRKVHAGEVWLNRSILSAVISDVFQEGKPHKISSEAVKIARLTARELEIIALLGEGRKNRQIGEQLGISEATVRHHLTSVFEKLEVEDRFELTIYAYQHGLATRPDSGQPSRKQVS